MERALKLLREAGARFQNSYEAMRGAKVIADALDYAKKEALHEAEGETSLVSEVTYHPAQDIDAPFTREAAMAVFGKSWPRS